MFREKYKHMCNQVSTSDELIGNILQYACSNEDKKRRHSIPYLKPLIAVLSICVCFSLVMPVLAARVEPIYQLMYLVSPSVAQFFMPVQKSDEDNGIKMEVVSAYIHDNVAEVYITLKDLTEDRIDGTTDLFDSYSIHRPFDSSAFCERVGYDEKQKTATFLISIEEWGNQKIQGDKLTFSLREFLSHKKIYENLPIPIELSTITASNHTQTVELTGGGGLDYKKYITGYTGTALIPEEPKSEFPVEGIELTAIGYVDGKLHIQTAVHDSLDNGNHGYFYLKDQNNNMIQCNYGFNFVNQYEQPGRIDYSEAVFDIPQDQIGNYKLYGYFVTSGLKTEGNWRVTFPLEEQ